MKKNRSEDTIVAISTPLGEGGIGIVRISGNDALKIADKIFVSKDKKTPSMFKTFTTRYGFIKATGEKSQVLSHNLSSVNCRLSTDYIDEALLTVMRSPKTYTKEDIVEINCHSGMVPLKKILELVIASGARLAQPGEFTKRAFLNGRIDLTQAEAVLDVIRSKTDLSLKAALNQLGGALKIQIDNIYEELVRILSHVEASIDFANEDINVESKEKLKHRLICAKRSIEGLLKNADYGQVLKEGVTVVINGRPNVGKSTLFNALLRKERAIVTPIAGTTRDILEEFINIKGIPFKLVDTAGIARTEDIVEIEGIRRAKDYMDRAAVILLVLEASEKISKDDIALIDEISDKEFIVVINKIDLDNIIDLSKISDKIKGKPIIKLSSQKGTNLDLLEDAMMACVFNGKAQVSEEPLVSSLRQKILLSEAKSALERAIDSIGKGLSEEFISLDAKEALTKIGEISGKVVTEEVLDKIFDQFCIGK